MYVAFTCQQAIEKVLKALYVKENHETPPYTHNLTRLFEYLSLRSELTCEQEEFLEDLNSYYIESRYTENFPILMRELTEETTKKVIVMTGVLLEWLKAKV